MPGTPHRRQYFTAALAFACACLSACASNERDFYPLDEARWWVYDITETVLDEDRERRYVVANLGTTRLDGETVFVQSMQSASRAYLRRAGDGVVQVAQRPAREETSLSSATPHVVLPPQLNVGQRWSVPSTLGLIESRTFAPADRVIARRYPFALNKTLASISDTVDVPGGRFGGCLRIDGEGQAFVPTDRGNSEAVVTIQTREWYAPGVGLVKLERSETSPSNFLKPGQQRWSLLDHGR